MKLAHYLEGEKVGVGIVEDEMIFPVSGMKGATIDQILRANLLGSVKAYRTKKGKSIDSVKLLSPVLSPEKIILVANNYPAHSKEEKITPPSEPYIFTRYANSLIGPGTPITVPKISKKADWEVELAVIIGKEGKYIGKGEALDYVAGYTISNDVSFRDLQMPPGWPQKLTLFGQDWVHGKSLDASFPLGPWLVTKDEIPGLPALDISLSVNGKVEQDSNTGEVLFQVDRLIECASKGITLKPGDVISTGTPHGIAFATGKPFLKDGDVIDCWIDKIGTLRNPVVEE
jgi:2-keto-4-pentenoate hydratase/2-oxohepta-3-ene-1,7-dioic acid hydratase in catechol pathway